MARVPDSGSKGREFESHSDHYITTLRPLDKVFNTRVSLSTQQSKWVPDKVPSVYGGPLRPKSCVWAL